jgi:hypothetical protein
VCLALEADRKVPAKQTALHCKGYPLKQEGCITQIRGGGGDTLASIITNITIITFSTIINIPALHVPMTGNAADRPR